ncbi:hypothetical protein NE237_017078 [Protea cynaroides]|uniref:Ubiquitin-conjugating enzyme E2C-binding protein n=1 Tax=Protea cynaroides TaxID=273540 RepID=A0A9Q0K7C9_9MAGN|nr:hypothetical protein NE237_017078 [Protea cynaroides]
MSSFSRAPGSENPRKWRFSWEAVGYVPTLRLFLFNPKIKPLYHCKNLNVHLSPVESLLLVSWTEHVQDASDSVDLSLRVPLPKVLVDPCSTIDVKATEDHIEVKLVLLLRVDHSVVAALDSVLNSSEDSSARENVCLDRLQPFSMDSDLKSLSSSEGVHFYCKSCSAQLTRKPLTSFVEMPSADWREVADNWFGACCCSFGGVSEKLVTEYVSSYSCRVGTCLVDVASVIICKSDLMGYVFPDHSDGGRKQESELGFDGGKNFPESVIGDGNICSQGLFFGSQTERASDVCEILCSMPLKEECLAANLELDVVKKGDNVDSSFVTSSISDLSVNETSASEFSTKDQIDYCTDKPNNSSDGQECCLHSVSVTCSNAEDKQSIKSFDLMGNQKLLLNGFLGNGFMIRSSNLSKDVKWIEFRCTRCSCLLGACPYNGGGDAPLDDGIRLFKCYISTGLPVGGSGNIFRNYTLERMFSFQLVESATNELLFRTVVKDLKTKAPVLRIVLLNSDAWCCTGYCLETMGCIGPASKVELQPVIKVLFSSCNDSTEAQSRVIEEWATKNQADEVYMFTHQIEEVFKSMKSAQEFFPFSCSFLQDFSLSFMERSHS